MPKRTWTIAAAILAFLALAYIGSPFVAVRQFKQAAVSGDVDRLDAAADFPAVRESLKSQMAVALSDRLQSDPEMRSNPFAGLGMMMIPTMVGKMVDAFVTPEGVSAMMRSGRMHAGKPRATVKAEVDYDYGYRTLDRFAVTAKPVGSTETEAPTFVFERRGILS